MAGKIELTPTTYGMWTLARLKEYLDPELYANIDSVVIDHMWSIYKMTAHVKRKGRKEPFVLECGFNSIFDKAQNRLDVNKADLARLILFLQ